MTKFILPYFGAIDIDALEEYYNTESSIDGCKISLDINFKNKQSSEAEMNVIKNFLENILDYDKKNKKALAADFKDEGSVHEYIAFHLEEVESESLSNLIDTTNKKLSSKKQLLSKLVLERIGFYPDGQYDSPYFAVFDYTLEGNTYVEGRRTITDQLIAISTDKTGKVQDLAWES